MIINRHILQSVKQSINEYPITLITGARQVGKTTLVTYFEEHDNYKYLSFDDSELLNDAKTNPKLFLEKYGYPLIIDEVQKAQNIFGEIEKNVNEVRRKNGSQAANGMYILTGSQKYNLMKEISESMSGRVSIIEMPPLSQSELNNWDEIPFEINNERLHSLSDERSLSEDILYTSIIRGFYPARWEIEGKPINNYFSNYIKTYIERDVSQLINLQDKVKFQNMLTVLASLSGEEFVIDNVAKTIGVDHKTVSSWLSIMVIGDIVTLLPPYYEDSINKRIVKRNKLYFNDTGLLCYLLGIDNVKTLKLSSFKGRIIETYIHNEIIKSYINNGLEPHIFYYRDSNQNEIDLVLLNDGKLNLVECKSGKKFTSDDVKGFRQLNKTKFEISGKCILCTAVEPYRIEQSVYAYNLKNI